MLLSALRAAMVLVLGQQMCKIVATESVTDRSLTNRGQMTPGELVEFFCFALNHAIQ
jgi:hypothetical protein